MLQGVHLLKKNPHKNVLTFKVLSTIRGILRITFSNSVSSLREKIRLHILCESSASR